MTTTTGGTGEPEDKPDAAEDTAAESTPEAAPEETAENTEVVAEEAPEETSAPEAADDVPAPTEPEVQATTESEAADDVPAPAPVFADPAGVPADVPDADELADADEDDLLAEAGYPTGPGVLSVLATIVALVAAAALAVFAFGFPALKGGPNEVPIGISGEASVTAQVKTLFTSGKSHLFTVTTYTEQSQLVDAIKDRKIYGGLAIGNNTATMLVASGASPTIAQTLNGVAQQLGASSQSSIPVEDVVPLPDKDPRGAAFEALGLPLLLAGLLPGLLLLWRRFAASTSSVLAAAFVSSLGAGFALGAILQYGFDAFAGNYLLNALSIALGIAAVAFPLAGLAAIGGRIGLGIGGALILLLGYPLSGWTNAPEWLPGAWGDLGQALPPGATATLLRSTAYFDGRGFSTALVVLVAWTVGGLVLVGIGALLNPDLGFEDDEPVLPPEEAPVPVG